MINDLNDRGKLESAICQAIYSAWPVLMDLLPIRRTGRGDYTVLNPDEEASGLLTSGFPGEIPGGARISRSEFVDLEILWSLPREGIRGDDVSSCWFNEEASSAQLH